MHRSIPRSLEKAQRPARIDLQQFWTKKSQVCPRIWTRLALAECYCFTACATTAAKYFRMGIKLILHSGLSLSLLELSKTWSFLIKRGCYKYKVSPFRSVWRELKWSGYESIYFLTVLYKAKAFFLYQFGKVIALINNDRINWESEAWKEKRQCGDISLLIKSLILNLKVGLTMKLRRVSNCRFWQTFL